MLRVLLPLLLFCVPVSAAGKGVLIVADEFPAMQVLAAQLKAQEAIESTIVKQTEIPEDLSPFRALIVYIHRDITPAAEKRFIDYTTAGGRLILLHHSISSGKRKNKDWFPFLNIELPNKDFADGGYKWIDPVDMDIVNLAPKEFITTHKVNYERPIAYPISGGNASVELPGFHLEHTEVYLNHVYTGPRTSLLGLKYTDKTTGQTYMQPTAGWYRPGGKGWVVYLMAGHSEREFQHPTYIRIVLNSVIADLK